MVSTWKTANPPAAVEHSGQVMFVRMCSVHALVLNHNPLDLIEAELVPPAIVELRRARRSMVRHRRGLFERAAVLKIGRDSDRSPGLAVRLSVEHIGTAAPTKPCRA